MILYNAVGCKTICVVEVVKRTDKMVILARKNWRGNNYRESGKNYFDTWEEAYECLLAGAKRRVDDAKGQLATAEMVLAEVHTMKKPE